MKTKSDLTLLGRDDREKLFQLTFENAAVGIAHVDEDGHFIGVNNKLSEITGYPKNELLQKTFQEITHPDDLENDLKQVEALRRGSIDSYTMEKRYYNKDGSILWVKLTGSAIIDSHNELNFFIAIIEDISEQKRIEKELEAKHQQSLLSEKKFRLLANNISQLAWMGDKKGRIFWYNKRWFDYTGMSHKELRGWGWKKLVHPDHLERVMKKLQDSWRTGKKWEEMFPLKGKNGQYRWFLSRAIPLSNEKEDIIRWFGTSTDVTEQQRTEDQLKKDNQLFETLIYITAHDLRGPIANMFMALNVMDHLETGEKLKLLDRFRELADQLDKIVRGITDLLRIRKTDKSNVTVISFEEVFNDIILEHKEELINSCVQGNFTEVKTIKYIEPFLYSIMNNLISNSIKYCRDEVPLKIEISTKRKEDYILLSIKDNGIGIDLDKNGEKLFKPFKRLDAKKSTGTGVGLYLVKNIIEKNEGYISVESSPGNGTTFNCYLRSY